MNENSINDAVTMRPGADASPGKIDQYELLQELGGGGFGCVYLAKDTVAGIEVAVKGLPPLVRQNREELENIRQNFALVSRLHHPNIAAALHLQKVQRAVYNDNADAEKLRVFEGDTLVVMQYAPGVTLSQWRKQFPEGKVPFCQALEIMRQIASALDYAHGEKILHRDIKPENMMIETSPDGRVTARVLDFGLAAEIRSSMGRVSREITDKSGTRPYMAPEQWLGGKQGVETDQYSLAVLFYELVTGEVPFASVFETGDPVVMMNVVGREPPEIPSDLPKHIQFALTRALAKKREERFGSCTEFANALIGRGLRPRRRRWGLAAGLALLAAVIAGGIWVGRGFQPRRAVEAAHPECAPYQNAVSTGIVETVDAPKKLSFEGVDSAKLNPKGAQASARGFQPRRAVEAAHPECAPYQDVQPTGTTGTVDAPKKLGFGGEDSAELNPKGAQASARGLRPRREVEAEAEQTRLDEENRKAELPAFQLSSKAESAHELIGHEPKEVKDFFADEIHAFENDRRAGDDAKGMSKNVIATNFFVKALASATALKAQMEKYEACKNTLSRIERAKAMADAVGAAAALPARYKEAQKASAAANAVFKAKRFGECDSKVKEAERQFVAIRADVVATTLGLAEGHKKAERWDECLKAAERVLKWEGDNAKALALKKCAESRIEPSVRFVIKNDGVILDDCFVYIGEKLVKAPFGFKEIQKGGRISPFDVVYSANRKKYMGRFEGCSVNWLGEKTFVIVVKEPKGVQLWEGGPYWAETNIGAEKPWEPGCYFWWGDTVGYKRVNDKWVASDGSATGFSFSSDNTPTYRKGKTTLQSEGCITADGVLAPRYDAAQAHRDGAWRIPTEQEFKDLEYNCEWNWTKMNGVNGYRICGKGAYASASIFLPAAGIGLRTSLSYAGSVGYYWSSVPGLASTDAWFLYFSSGNRYAGNYYRIYGQSVRAVQGFPE